ncbi:MAG TPA: PLP-dependent aminotransferase family protein [Steroidobacteraceae bacterium]|nr:PLP-dependent aminotransferase family protein [Steroidobacteraceae bacterium]
MAVQISGPRSLRARLVEELRAQIASGGLAAGMALPSVRRLARERGVSAFTAAEVYNVLTAAGLIEARRGSGYFVAGPRPAPPPRSASATADALWERRLEARAQPILVDAGGGWLPAAWQYGDGIRAGLRSLARRPLPTDGYGSPLGLEALRAHFATQLASRGLALSTDQLLLTQGASQALDLIVRALLSPGDRVAVEDPGYPPTLELLRARGVRLVGIPRLANGPDADALAAALKRRPVRALFTNTTLQNPTGTTTELPVARRVLELAERHGLLVVEDDIFADLAPTPAMTLATLDQCRRVVYVSSISKAISPTLRVGYVVAPPEAAPRLARLKALSALASSELAERLVLEVMMQPHYRRHLEALRRRLATTQQRVQAALLGHGVELAFRPAAGMFVWGRLRSRETVGRLWRAAVAAGVLLAPGELFRPDGRATPYWRFNVAHCDGGALGRFLDGLAERGPA